MSNRDAPLEDIPRLLIPKVASQADVGNQAAEPRLLENADLLPYRLLRSTGPGFKCMDHLKRTVGIEIPLSMAVHDALFPCPLLTCDGRMAVAVMTLPPDERSGEDAREKTDQDAHAGIGEDGIVRKLVAMLLRICGERGIRFEYTGIFRD